MQARGERERKEMKIKAILGIDKAKVLSWGRGSGTQSKSIYYQVALAERHQEGFAESILIKGRKREEKNLDGCLAARQELAIVFAN